MLVLHAHWQPPARPDDTGQVLSWAETSDAPAPAWQRGRLPQKPLAKPHPFCAEPDALRPLLGGRPRQGQAVLLLPASRTGPLPSPGLLHDWPLDAETPPFLSPWVVSGLWLPAADALAALIDLLDLEMGVGDSAAEEPARVQASLGADARYWHTAAGLVLETLAAQKLVPVLAQVDAKGRHFHARWLPVLDGPKDAPRLRRLEAAIPPVCLAGLPAEGSPPSSPHALLHTFLNSMCDALARRWGRPSAPRSLAGSTEPALAWLAALFRDDPRVEISQAQAQSLSSGHRAWMRGLYAAGDTTFRIAFRLEAPERLKDPWLLHYLLQARDDPSLFIPAAEVWDARASVLRHLGRRFEQPQEKLLAGLGYASRLFPAIAGSLKSRRPLGAELNAQEAYAFLRQAAPVLESAGFGLLAPPWWNKPGNRLGARLRLRPAKARAPSAITRGNVSFENLVSYQWELSVGDTALTEQEFLALAALKSPLVQIRGQWVQLDAEQVEAAIKFWESRSLEGEMGLLEAVQLGLGAEETVAGLPVDAVESEGWLADWLERLEQPDRVAELPQPTGLHGELRPYQRYGFSWLHFLRRWGLGACLADDMGLGKTVQTIALLLAEKEAQGRLPAPTLLVCPTSVVTNWEREVTRFAPALTTMVHQGAGRLRGKEFAQAAGQVDMVLTSYALARQDAEAMQAVPWLGVILDEAQNIKNPSAKQTQAVRRLSADFRLALTGTPVENRLSELWSIMHFLNPGYLGSQQSFRREYGLPIERYNDEDAASRLKKLVSPFILRRVKTDPRVIQDLPDKLEMKVYCRLSEEQATLYQAVVQDAMEKIESSEGIERRGLVLSLLMQLKQICNHPVQYLHQVGQRPDTEDLPEKLAARAGKLERLVEMLEEALSVGDRALVFTQFAQMGRLLSAFLPQALGVPVLFLHGGVPAKARDAMVRRFQEDEHSPPVFILSLKAGGTGLNLTRASHVFHYDRWWNPAVEDQATDRAFRIGQTRNVQVHKLITAGTLEEMIDEMIESKKGLAQAVIGSGEAWLTELSTEELREAVRLRGVD